MIDYLRGFIAHVDTDYIVIDVSGVGYRVFCANPHIYRTGREEEAMLFIHYHVREDAILLYGFANRTEQLLFRKLIEVTGIGPKVALGILSAGRPEQVVSAIRQENLAFLTKLPGIGKKTAQRIILEMKEKVEAVLGAGRFAEQPADHNGLSGRHDGGNSGSSPAEQTAAEAAEALKALGYTEAEAERVLDRIRPEIQPEMPVDAVIKMALQQFARM